MKIYGFLVFCIVLICNLCQEDYYQILGLNRNANDDDLKRAFKKLSLKYHPDKNLGNQQEAQSQFSKVANAYEILKDPQLKQIYDRGGEAGLKQHQEQQNFQQQQQQQNRGWHDMFGQQQFGGQQNNLFENSEVQDIQLSTLTKFLRRQDVWVIYFYKNTQESRQYKDLWIDFAKKFYGIFRVAAINCQQEDVLCHEEFQVYDSPSVYVFQANIRSEAKKFNGVMEVQELAKFAVGFMESFVSLVTSSNYESFIQTDPTLNTLILFSDKKSTPPLFKALSKDLKGKLVFGQVRDTETELLKKFGVSQFPTLMILTDVYGYKGIVYESTDYRKDQIMRFLREYAYTSSTRKYRKSTEFQELTQQHINNGNCAQNENLMCVVLITDGGIDIKQNMIFDELAGFYRDDPYKFYYIDRSNLNYSDLLQEIDDQFPKLVVIKPKKDRISIYQSDLNSIQLLKYYFDEIIGGSIQFKKMFGSLHNSIIRSDL